MDSAASTIRQFLIEAQRRISCHAVAFTSPSRDEFHFHCHSDDAREVEEILRGIADTFLLQARDSNSPVIRNRVRYENGGPMIGRFLVAPVFESYGELAGIVMMYRLTTQDAFEQGDIKKGSQLSRQLARLLSLPADPVTGLIARAGIEKLVDWRLKSLGERANSSVLYGDIDQLHVVNDMFGFEAGDRAIAVVANALAAALANEDAVLSRLSGDRFTVFLPDCPLPQAQKIAARLRDAVQARSLTSMKTGFRCRFVLARRRCAMASEASITPSPAPKSPAKPPRSAGAIGVEVYQVSDTSMIRRRDDISIVGRLRSALDEGRYQIFAQPIASLLTPDSVHRYEMLLRIIDEKGRMVLPSHFMSSATRYQLLPQIDRLVIIDVLKHLRDAQLAAWLQAAACFHQPVRPDHQRRGLSRLAANAARRERRQRRVADLRADRDRRGQQHGTSAAADEQTRRSRLPLRAR